MILYTSDGCASCSVAKKYIEENGVDIEIIHLDLSTREGRDLAMDNSIRGVPILIDGENIYIGSEVLDFLMK